MFHTVHCMPIPKRSTSGHDQGVLTVLSLNNLPEHAGKMLHQQKRHGEKM
jgi:hypothetical protein